MGLSVPKSGKLLGFPPTLVGADRPGESRVNKIIKHGWLVGSSSR